MPAGVHVRTHTHTHTHAHTHAHTHMPLRQSVPSVATAVGAAAAPVGRLQRPQGSCSSAGARMAAASVGRPAWQQAGGQVPGAAAAVAVAAAAVVVVAAAMAAAAVVINVIPK